MQAEIDKAYQGKLICFIITDNFEYKNNKQVIEVCCSKCKKIIESRIDLLTQGRKSCKCVQIRSKLEKQVNDILKKNKLNYDKEFSFPDLRYIQPLRFDFCIHKDNFDYLIECDGIQHFYPTFGEESFNRIKITDKIKNEYCIKNNIPLLRIPYNEKESIEEIIIKFINP